MKLYEIKNFVSNNPNTNLSQLFAKYQMDLESILVSAILLDLDYKDLAIEFQKRLQEETDLVDKVESYIEEDELFNKIFIPSVKLAFLILIYLPKHKEKSLEIVDKVLVSDSYLKDICKENIFDNNDIIFFSIQSDFKRDFIAGIREKISNLDIAFIEPAFKEFWIHFKLNNFLVWDQDSERIFIETIKKNLNEIQQPTLIHQKAIIEESCVKVFFDNSYLEHSILGLTNKIDFSKILSNFIKSFTDDIKDELVESGVKYLITSAWGFGYLDFTVKGVKNFVLALHSVSSPLSRDKVLEDFARFQLSGKNSVKEWFLEEKKRELTIALESSNIDLSSVTIDKKMFESYYSKFIERYFVLYGLRYDVKEIPQNHTEIFTAVYDGLFNYNLRLNSSF